jgi:hypothetical protein
MKLVRTLSLASMLILLDSPQMAHAVAYCALRDPLAALKTMYPDADSQHSMVSVIGPDTRDHVAESLPFSLHFNELGKHTLYVVMQGTLPLGLIHTRSEPSAWGLVEIIWSLNTDLSIRDFQFQRCRSKHCMKLETPEFKAQLRGKSAQQLKDLISPDGQSIREGALKVPQGADALALSVLRSAMKTSVVTNHAWREELLAIRVQEIGSNRFDGMAAIEKIDNVYPRGTLDLISSEFRGSSTAVIRDSVRVYRFIDSNEHAVGYVVSAELDLGHYSGRYIWAFAPDGRILEVSPVSNWPSTEVRRLFSELHDKHLASQDQCGTAISLATFELTMLLPPHDTQ